MIFDILLLIVLIICFITDIKVRKIYNKVILPALIITILLHLVYSGFNGLKFSIIGFAMGIGLLLIPFMLGGIGAGDVKLLALIGAIKGTTFALNTAIYMSLIGGIIALSIIISHKTTLQFLKSLFWWTIGIFRGTFYKLEVPTTPLLKKFPYSTAIAGGALVCLLFKGVWII